MKFFTVFLLAAAAGCNGGTSAPEPTPDVVGDPAEGETSAISQDCKLPAGAALSSFKEDGSLLWTSDALASDRSMTVRYCDGPVLRATRITGLMAGEAKNWQKGAMTDGSRVIHVDDVRTLSSEKPVPVERLEGVTIQCIPLLGSCDPTPAVAAAVAATN